MNKLIYIVILLLFQLNIIAENYKFYTINDGLSSSQISYITQDSEGYIYNTPQILDHLYSPIKRI